MTKNQLEYWKLQEQKRSNQAQESETHRTNVARETETHRANVAQESLGWGNLRELGRHNLATEAIGQHQADSSRLQAQSSWYQAQTADRNATTNALNAETKQYEAETGRMQQQIQSDRLAMDQKYTDHKISNETWNTVFKGIDTALKTTKSVTSLVNLVKMAGGAA